ncbi:MAG TPA: hypothetical protein VNK52_02665 [Hyphomicrobiaceae bacterium]|nr:hypothetical protein [Hyphomicrobiaceae bacterium]
MWKRLAGVILVLALAGMMAGEASAQRGDRRDWVLLGQQSVGFLVDRDVIRIGQSEDWFRNRSFSALHFEVLQNDIHLQTIRLVYINGYTETLAVDRLIRAGSDLAVDLRGERSYLRQIEMTYRSRPNFRGQAVVRVYGEPARRGAPALVRSGPGPRPDWIVLGRQSVGFGVDRDSIIIGQPEDWFRTRSFRTLYLEVSRNDVHLMDVRIIYLNGYQEEFRVDRLVRQGEVLPIDLRGERSYLRRVDLTYRARPSFRGEAVVTLYGEPAGRGDGPPAFAPGRGDWVELGCQQVALFGRDSDSIRVGRREGRFRSIRLEVRGADVEILDLKVIYANGASDDIQVRHFLRAGERTRPLDLKGWERAIDRVVLNYRTKLNPVDIIAKQRISTATVCVEGLQ